MNGPAKDRLHEYEAGGLTLLIEMEVATKQEATTLWAASPRLQSLLPVQRAAANAFWC